jgi:hypothetical protein
LENCQYDLETYIKKFKSNDLVTNGDWDHMLRFSVEISQSLVHLHNRGIYLDGKLNPRTIWVQQIGQDRPALKIVLPGRENAFNTGNEYNITWNQNISEQSKDLLSLTLLLFFIQTCGCHFKESSDMSTNMSSDIVLTNRTTFLGDILGSEYCSGEVNGSREYRVWKNSLAGHLIDWILENVTNGIVLDSEEILKHPFYWNHWKILSFISITSNFLQEYCQRNNEEEKGNEQQREQQRFEETEVYFDIMADVRGEDNGDTSNFNGIKAYMKTLKGSRTRNVNNYLDLVKAIRDKVGITFIKFSTHLMNQFVRLPTGRTEAIPSAKEQLKT